MKDEKIMEFIPDSKDVMKVINNLQKVLPHTLKNGGLAMDKPWIEPCEDKDLCGTLHCHGGWYVVAIRTQEQRMSDELMFTNGADEMSRHLGFHGMEELERWAQLHNVIWGNDRGAGLFSTEIAFYNEEKRPEGAQSLSDIIDHWTEVHDRIVAIEAKKSPRHEDITSQLAVLPPDESSDVVKVRKLVKN